MHVTVFCSSSDRIPRPFFSVAEELGTLLGKGGHTLVYGGGSTGLMGVLARSVQRAGGRVVGILPEFMRTPELAYEEADELILTRDMRERKALLEARGDAFLVLPGGFGTLEELLEVLTLKQLERHRKPIVLLNALGFYDPLLGFFERLVRDRFAYVDGHALYRVVETPQEAVAALEGEGTGPA